jgi:protein-disulfide isomerase
MTFTFAQTNRRGTQPAQTSKQAKPTPSPTVASPSPSPTTTANTAAAPPRGALAVVNGQAITVNDLADKDLRDMVNGIDDQIKQLRKQGLDDLIGRMLLDAEAKKIGVTVDQLIGQQVRSKIVEPTEDEISRFYAANKDQMQGADLATARPQIAAFLKDQATQAAGNTYLQKLKAAAQITMGPDPNAPNLPPTTVLATVNGQKLTAGDLDERLKPYAYQLRLKIFEAEREGLDQKINDILLNVEAKKVSSTPEDLVKKEITSKVTLPTDAEITKFYNDNKDRLQGTLDALKTQISDFLQQQQAHKLEYDFAQKLRAGASIQTYLLPPEPPVQNISTQGGVSRGNPNAPVTMVEFTDFQCPFCAQTYPIIEKLSAEYGDKLRLVVRDNPLAQHQFARKAAEAAAAADAQGKFFEYAAILFKNQSALDVDSLKKYASQIGLDRAKFDAALDRGVYAERVAKNLADAQFYAIDSTPTIFVNGVRLTDITEVGIKAAIDKALASKGITAGAPATRR